MLRWFLYREGKRWGFWGVSFVVCVFMYFTLSYCWALVMFTMCSLNVISIPEIFVFTSGYVWFFSPHTLCLCYCCYCFTEQIGTHPLKG